MRCASCGTTNRPEARFCRACGTWLAAGLPGERPLTGSKSRVCMACGKDNLPGALFCAACGLHLEPAVPVLPLTSSPELPAQEGAPAQELLDDEAPAVDQLPTGAPVSAAGSAAPLGAFAQVGTTTLVEPAEEPATAEATTGPHGVELSARSDAIPFVEQPPPVTLSTHEAGAGPEALTAAEAAWVEEAGVQEWDEPTAPAWEAVTPRDAAIIEIEARAWGDASPAPAPVPPGESGLAEPQVPAGDEPVAPLLEPVTAGEAATEETETPALDEPVTPAPELVMKSDAGHAETEAPVWAESASPAPEPVIVDQAQARAEAPACDEPVTPAPGMAGEVVTVEEAEAPVWEEPGVPAPEPAIPIGAGVGEAEAPPAIPRPPVRRTAWLGAGMFAALSLLGAVGYFAYTQRQDRPAAVSIVAPSAAPSSESAPSAPPPPKSKVQPQPQLLPPLRAAAGRPSPPPPARAATPTEAPAQSPAPEMPAEQAKPEVPPLVEVQRDVVADAPASPRPATPSRVEAVPKGPAARNGKAKAPAQEPPRAVEPPPPEPQPAQIESPPPAKVADSAPPPAPPQPAEPAWQVALRADLERCRKTIFLERVLCNERARWRYCSPNRWGSVPECALVGNSPGPIR